MGTLESNAELAATLRRVERAAGSLATASVGRMDETLAWFRELPADQRSLVMLVVQAGIRSLVDWLRQGAGAATQQEVSDLVFDAAPQALARSISLQQTVALVKVTIDVVEEQVPHLAAPGEAEALREAVLKFSREIAFAAARVYARAAETRGAWDARLQALLVDALLRGDSSDVLASRAAALGWADKPPVAVAVGHSPGGEAAAVLHTVYRSARRIGAEILGGVHGDRLVVVIGGAADPLAATAKLLAGFGTGPVVVGPPVPSLDQATESARAALAGYRAAAAWPRRARSPPTTCCPSGRWPGTPRRAGYCASRSTARWPEPAANCWRRWTRFSPPAGYWRAPLGGCSCTRTRSGTGCGGSRK
jgi:GGDEF-like domain